MVAARSVRLQMEGRVQGVYFRVSARDRARELGLSGWVRNLSDGSVEALASGDDDSVEAFIAWCRKGPTAARVDRLRVEPAGETAEGDFEVRR